MTTRNDYRPRDGLNEFVLRDAEHPLGSDYDINDNGCWIWKWCLRENRFPVTSKNGKVENIRQIIYRDTYGKDVHNKHIRHKYDNCSLLCIIPSHLYVKEEKKKKERVYKLTPEDIDAIRGSSQSLGVLSKEYGVDPSLISRIKNGIRVYSYNRS